MDAVLQDWQASTHIGVSSAHPEWRRGTRHKHTDGPRVCVSFFQDVFPDVETHVRELILLTSDTQCKPQEIYSLPVELSNRGKLGLIVWIQASEEKYIFTAISHQQPINSKVKDGHIT